MKIISPLPLFALVSLALTGAAWSAVPSKSSAFFTTAEVTVRQARTAPEVRVGDDAWHISDVNDYSLGKCRKGDVLEVSFTGSWTAFGESAMQLVVFENGHDVATMYALDVTTVQAVGTIAHPLGTPFAVHGAHLVDRSGDCRVALRYFASVGTTLTVGYTASETDSGGSFVVLRRTPAP